ncbi:MAG: Gfo/Idh/MocA family oxidoreductase [Bacteroidota bacterium]
MFVLIVACSKSDQDRREIGTLPESSASNAKEEGVAEKESVKTEATYRYPGEALRVGVIGLVHTHVHWILGREEVGDIEIVGIVEPNRELAERYSKQHGYSMDIVYNTMEEMVAATKPEAVTAFNTIEGHLKVVEFCAPKGIHVMVEKPLAVNWAQAQKMIALAQEHQIQLLTNYETSWYPGHYQAYEMIHREKKIGDIRKMIFYTGHQGPKEIGVNEEFLEWLTDPVQNGGGALTDFGCYGANLATWLLKGATPISVSCLTQQIKPDIYPKVEDEATILLTYPKTQVIIQASWNWSHGRKDTEIYGVSGYVFCNREPEMEVLLDEETGAFKTPTTPLEKGLHDPFALLTKVIKEGHPLEPFNVSGLDNNRIVMQILEAAKASAKTGKVIQWKEFFGEGVS